MVIERAEFPIKPGQEEAFAAAMAGRARTVLLEAEGCRSVVTARGIENPDTFILLLEWDSVDAHTAFTKTPAYKELGGLIGGLVAGPANMAHFQPV